MSVYVTVVIPTYKRPDLLSRCLLALAKQTYPLEYFEVIVVADGPDHETYSIVQHLREFHPSLNLAYYETPEKRGPATARNLGWKHGKGELVAFTDDDCVPSMSWLSDFYKAYVSHNRELLSLSGKVSVPISQPPTDYERNIANLETADFIMANCAVTRKALELTQGFDEEFPVAWREDSALEFSLLELDVPIFKIDKALVTHPVREAPWGVSIKEQKKSMFNALLFKKYPELYKRKIADKPVWKYYVIIFLSISAVISFLLNKPVLGCFTTAAWIYFVGRFIFKRLANSDLSFTHRTEMIFTSLIIPYLSVYWTLRGAIRYKVFFL